MTDGSDKIFFLGAGFSKAVNPDSPTLAELTKVIYSDMEQSPLYPHFQSIAVPFRQNIEDMLTYLSSELPWKNETQKALDKALYIELSQKISNYFVNIRKTYTHFDKYKNLWLYMALNSISSITLNYDVLLETYLQSAIDNLHSYTRNPENHSTSLSKIMFCGSCSSEEHHEMRFDSFYNEIITDIQKRICNVNKHGLQVMSPSIFKLHGSANWRYSGQSTTDSIYCLGYDNSEEERYIKELVPYIVPPVLDKTSSYNHNMLKYIWKQAASRLCKAKEIYIIGFSFPMTDVSIRYLFQSIMHESNDYKVFVINTKNAIDKGHPHYIVDRYKAIFGDRVNFDYCCDDSLKIFMDKNITPLIDFDTTFIPKKTSVKNQRSQNS